MKGTDLKTGDTIYVRDYSYVHGEIATYVSSVTKVTKTRVYGGID